MQPLRALGVEITPEVVDRERWEAFWDAPLDIPGITPGAHGRGNNLPPDLPRNAVGDQARDARPTAPPAAR